MAAPQYTGQNRRENALGPQKWTPRTYSFIFATGTNGNTYIQRVKLPADFRVAETNVISDVIVATVQYAISNGAAGGTDIVANRAFPASDTHETLTPTSATALANRDMVKGDVLTATLVTSGGAGAFTNLRVDVSGYEVGYIVADPKDD